MVPLVEQELLTIPEHLSSLPVFNGVGVTRSVVLCVFFVHRFVLFLLTSMLSVLLRIGNYDCPWGIFVLFLSRKCGIHKQVSVSFTHYIQYYIKCTTY